MPKEQNIWLARFDGLQDQDELIRRATVRGQPLTQIEDIPLFGIQKAVQGALGSFYLPSAAEVRILMRLIEQAMAHCWRRYADRQAYLTDLYCPYAQFESEFVAPHCLTGPAGVGKTALIAALRRILPANTPLDLGPAHPKADLIGHWHIEVRDRSSPSSMLRPFVDQEYGESRRVTNSELSRVCAKSAHRNGVPLILLDELQFLTQSASASTLITKTLYQLAYIGVPLVFVANYSLCRLLLGRQEQDKQRLLTAPLILTPCSPESDDWLAYLNQFKQILGKSLQIDLEQEAGTIYHFTAGLKRLAIKLMATAYENVWRQGRRQVRIEDIANAYEGTSFAANRTQIKAMLMPHPSMRTKPYECPFPLPADESNTLHAIRKQARDRALHYKVQQEVMTPQERKQAQLQRPVMPTPAPASPEPLRKKVQRKRLSAEELLETEHHRRGKNLYPRGPSAIG